MEIRSLYELLKPTTMWQKVCMSGGDVSATFAPYIGHGVDGRTSYMTANSAVC